MGISGLFFVYLFLILVETLADEECWSRGTKEVEKAMTSQNWRPNDEKHPNYGHSEIRPEFTKMDLEVISQELHSFCIVGNHFHGSALKDWSRFSFLEPLFLPNGFLDIGSHICPIDYKKMNVFTHTDDVFIESYAEAGTYGPREQRQTQNWPYHPPKRWGDKYWKQYKDSDARFNRPPLKEGQKAPDCVNPYFIQADEITLSNPSITFTERLQNWLHLTIFARNELIDPEAEKNKCPTGKIKYVFLEVRDQLGFQVGDFSTDIPCHASCKCRTANCVLMTGNRHSAMPCMHTHVRATTQAGIFIAAASANGSEYWIKRQGNSTGEGYVNEVHATWKFAHHTSYLITQLHFAALIIEDETKLKYWTGRRINWEYAFSERRTDTNNNHWYNVYTYDYFATHSQSHKDFHRPYGFTPQYFPLLPTFRTLGAWDPYREEFYLPKDINCHAGISTDNYIFDPFSEGKLPRRPDDLYPSTDPGLGWMKEMGTEKDPWKQNPRGDIEKAKKIASEEDKDNIMSKYEELLLLDKIQGRPSPKERPLVYFGTEFSKKHYDSYDSIVENRTDWKEHLSKLKTMTEIADEERCPCTIMMSTLPPEYATKSKNELQGRKLHALQMLVAWMILVPIGIFIIRYYKETYSRVFFMEEFWWYTIHVLCLGTALFFMLGGIYVLELKRTGGESTWTDETWSHIVLGALLMIFFTIQLFLGPWRLWDVDSRIVQIILHFTCGALWFIIAIIVIMISAAMPFSFMNCWAFSVYCIFLIGLVFWVIAMEVHMRHVDKELDLHPPRTYLPPPVVRVFHRNAPHAKFRIYVLCFFVLYCLFFFFLLRAFLSEESDIEIKSCFQKEHKKEEIPLPDDYEIYTP